MQGFSFQVVLVWECLIGPSALKPFIWWHKALLFSLAHEVTPNEGFMSVYWREMQVVFKLGCLEGERVRGHPADILDFRKITAFLH